MTIYPTSTATVDGEWKAVALHSSSLFTRVKNKQHGNVTDCLFLFYVVDLLTAFKKHLEACGLLYSLIVPYFLKVHFILTESRSGTMYTVRTSSVLCTPISL